MVLIYFYQKNKCPEISVTGHSKNYDFYKVKYLHHTLEDPTVINSKKNPDAGQGTGKFTTKV